MKISSRQFLILPELISVIFLRMQAIIYLQKIMISLMKTQMTKFHGKIL